MLRQDIRDAKGVPWREKTGRHRTFEKKLEEGGSDSSIDTAATNPSANSNNNRLSSVRQGKVVRRTSMLISGTDAGTPDAEADLDGRHVAGECYKCLHIDVENPDGSPGEFLSFPPYSAPGGLQETLFPEERCQISSSTSVATPTLHSLAAKHEKDVAHLPSDAPGMDQLEESLSSLQVIESSADYLMKTLRRMGVIAGASVLRIADLSVYEEAHFATGDELNDCADLTHLGGCGCFEEQRRLRRLRLEASEIQILASSSSTATASAHINN
mmetsp:Transcript_20248/g.58093  ORF Transcript_20248/g.58093 Transcript_20248/m.58093 type:complete len:271 (+) Transcript_20248:200-1012(+)